jgi:hypothetical protein
VDISFVQIGIPVHPREKLTWDTATGNKRFQKAVLSPQTNAKSYLPSDGTGEPE